MSTHPYRINFKAEIPMTKRVYIIPALKAIWAKKNYTVALAIWGAVYFLTHLAYTNSAHWEWHRDAFVTSSVVFGLLCGIVVWANAMTRM